MPEDKDNSLLPVGYKRPPEHTRFQPGRSGNPKGRSKRPPSLQDDLEAELNQKSATPDATGKGFLTRQRAMIKGLVDTAIEGDLRAIATVIDLSANKFAAIEAGESLEPSEEDIELLNQYVDREISRRGQEEKK